MSLQSLRPKRCSHEHLKEKNGHSKITYKLVYDSISNLITSTYDVMLPNWIEFNKQEWMLSVIFSDQRFILTCWRKEKWDSKFQTNLSTLAEVVDKDLGKATARFLWLLYCQGVLSREQLLSVLDSYRSSKLILKK